LVTGLHMAHLSGEANTAFEERGNELNERLSFPLYGLFANGIPDQWHCVCLSDDCQCYLHIYNCDYCAENQGSLGTLHSQSRFKAVSGKL